MDDIVKLGFVVAGIILAIYLLQYVFIIAVIAGLIFLVFYFLGGVVKGYFEHSRKTEYQNKINSRIEVVTQKKSVSIYEDEYDDFLKDLCTKCNAVKHYDTYEEYVTEIDELREKCAFAKYECEYCSSVSKFSKKFVLNVDLIELCFIKRPPKDSVDLKIISLKKWLACFDTKALEETIKCYKCGHKISALQTL